MKTTWFEEITAVLEDHNESWDDVEHCTLSHKELNRFFNANGGGIQGLPFTVWTKDSVLFPVSCEGYEWVERVSRNPDGVPTDHIGDS